ncbi:MAG: redoxin domain-containing protein [Verrucomicrobiota bacterium]
MKNQLCKSAIIAVLIATTPSVTFGETAPPPPAAVERVAANTQSVRPDLTGTVQTKTGEPVQATVFIATAGPKEGTSPFCPSCYPDCQKSAKTDAAGKFVIKSLDSQLRFQILAVATGFKPVYVKQVDPAKGPITATMSPIELAGAAPGNCLHGRVIDTDNKPVAGAVVNLRGVTRGQSTQFGGNAEVDQVAVSDTNGVFLITSRKPFDSAGVDVEARGLAKGIFQNLATGSEVHTLKLTEGATVKGRVVLNGKPLAGVEMNVSGANRESSVFAGYFTIGTDADGKFLFANLPPRTEYLLCGTMKSLGARGCIPARNIRAGDDSGTSDVGEVEVRPAFVLGGQIRLTDGKPLPAHQRVQLSREGPWDSAQMETDNAGHFKFVGVPPEQVGISARVPGYRLSLRNVSLDQFNQFRLIGRMITNKTDFILELEPGKSRPHENEDWESAIALRQEQLRGAEGGGTPPPDAIKITGTVIDADTQKPLPEFTVTEGRKNSFSDQINWLLTRVSVQSNGAFAVNLSRRPQSPPAVSVAADGYVPQNSGLITTGETNFAFVLKKGTGPSGVVLSPSGKLATNVTVYLADANRSGVYIGDAGKMVVRENIYPGTRKTKTDGSGHFSFPALPDAYAVLVVDTNGFADVRVGVLETTREVRLQKYARVEGQLMIGARPGSNETVNLDRAYIPYADYPRDFPPLNLFLSTRTDAEGRFVFERVPPIAVSLYHQPKVRDSSTGTIAQSQTTGLLLVPGETRQITLGGNGRAVIGRLAVTGYDGQINYRADVQTIETIVPPTEGLPDLSAISAEFASKLRSFDSDEARKTAMDEHKKIWDAALKETRDFYRSDAGRPYYFSKHRYALNFSREGTFRIEDVPGGKYNLRIELHEASGDQPFNQPLIGSLAKEIVVPDSPGGRSDEAFDLGVLELAARHSLKTGKPAPDFAAKTFDGQPLKLADFKGKYLLLDFWATWCGPCVAETPYLKAVWKAFKDDPHFAMVSLSLDPEVEAPRKFAAKNETGWMQGFLGDWSKSDVPARWNVEGIPAIFLIGPDGKIIVQNLRGEAIKTAVGAALGAK